MVDKGAVVSVQTSGRPRGPLVLTIVGAVLTTLALALLVIEIVLALQPRYGDLAWLRIALAALSAVGAGLVLWAGVTRLRKQRRPVPAPRGPDAALQPVVPGVSNTRGTGSPRKNRTATVALVVAIVGFVVKALPIVGDIAGGPENIVAVVLGIIALVTAIRRGTPLQLPIAAILLGATPLAGTFVGEGSLW